MANDKRVIACNYTEGISAVSEGSLCYVIDPGAGMGHERVYVYARARDGRWIKKWESMKRLSNFRVKTLPPESPLYSRLAWARDFDADKYCADLVQSEKRIKGTGDGDAPNNPQ